MFLTTHAAVGMLISQHTGSPLGTLGWSFASHFVLDFIPHGDEELYGQYTQAGEHRWRRAVIVNTIDVAILVILSIWVISHQEVSDARDRYLLIGILGSILPDFLSNLFPVIHERFSWLRLIRWVYAITKPTGLRYIVRGQNWIHTLLHHKIIRSDVPFAVGLVVQIVIIGVVLGFALQPA